MYKPQCISLGDSIFQVENFKSNKVISILIPIILSIGPCRLQQVLIFFKHKQVTAWESGRLQGSERKVRTAKIIVLTLLVYVWLCPAQRRNRRHESWLLEWDRVRLLQSAHLLSSFLNLGLPLALF